MLFGVETVKAFILAAGESTRMKPLTVNIPKPLLLVAGKPFLQHTIETLKKVGIRDIAILIGWRQEAIKEYFGNGKKFGVNIKYILQDERLGTAHAIGLAEKHFKVEFLCINGDVFAAEKIIKDLIKFYKKNNGIILTLAKRSGLKNYGIVELKGKKILKIIEKPTHPQSALVNAGIYIFTPKIFSAIKATPLSKRGEYEITDSIQMLINKYNVFGYSLKDQDVWMDISMPWDLITANELFLKKIRTKIQGEIELYTKIIGKVQVGKGTVIKNGSYIVGPVVIGNNCDIGPNCLIRSSTTIGNNCKVGNAVEFKNSIIMDNTKIPHHSYVGDSIIGMNCNLGSGTKIANLRLDEKNIKVVVKGETIDTGRRKLGVIMGDNVKTGINSTINVGSIIGEDTFIGPGAIAQGTIAPKSIIH
jgi:bifunctional UDP-N-acetylglucosamine pyrophosphorylase/glucosamine-1-phosphate N-acetyltransferase